MAKVVIKEKDRKNKRKDAIRSLVPEPKMGNIRKEFYIASVQDTVAVKAVHDGFGLIESYDGMFVKSYWPGGD